MSELIRQPQAQPFSAVQGNQIDFKTKEKNTAQNTTVKPLSNEEITIGISKKIDYSDPTSLYMLFPDAKAEKQNLLCTNIKYRADGKITDFFRDGVRYSVRYDAKGNISKLITQSFGSDFNEKVQQTDDFVNEQRVIEFDSEGNTTKDTTYSYYKDSKGNRQQVTKNNLDAQKESLKVAQSIISAETKIQLLERNLKQLSPKIDMRVEESLAEAKRQLSALLRLTDNEMGNPTIKVLEETNHIIC